MEKFEIGQIFEGEYPPEAAWWCNENNAHIEETTQEGAEVRTFAIVANPEIIPTHEDMIAFITQEADRIAYGGITIIKDEQKYLFKTDTQNITLCNSLSAALASLPDDSAVPWEVWQGSTPVMLPITKAEFTGGFTFGTQMVIQAFTVKGTFITEQGTFTDEQLADAEFIGEFKARVTATLEAVPREYSLDPEPTDPEPTEPDTEPDTETEA